MTVEDTQHETGTGAGDVPVFDWRLAPAHYLTRRQLRAAGLGPNRQGVAAWLRPEKPGHRWARLFDKTRAGPKRVPSEAQLEAARKAVHAHQLRAAERRGYSREDLAAVSDPGPGWHTPQPTTTHQEENPMSTNESAAPAMDEPGEIHNRAAELERMLEEAQRSAPVWPDSRPEAAGKVVRAQEELEKHLREYRGELGNDSHWNSHYAGLDYADERIAAREEIAAQIAAAYEQPDPIGHGQRTAYLLATVAVHQARDRIDRLTAAAQAEGGGPEAAEVHGLHMEGAQEQAEERLQASTQQLGPASVAPLADALVWQNKSEIAATRLAEITTAYAQGWGVVVDADGLTVTVDREFDPVSAQDYTEAAALRAREAAAVDIVSAMAMTDTAKARVSASIAAWYNDTAIDPTDPGAYLHEAHQRRELLGGNLGVAPDLGDADRARVEFVVDYLRGDVSKVDLLASPVFVDPGEEVRSRVPALLETFAENPRAAKLVAREISVMSVADHKLVSDAGTAIAAGQKVDYDLWPGYVGRYALGDDLIDYADDAEELRRDADYLPEAIAEGVDNPELWGISDDVGARIARMAEAREDLLTQAREGKGLASVERAQIAVTVGDIDAGRILGHAQLPELVWADERSKGDIDYLRTSEPAARLATATREAVTQLVDAAGVDDRSRAAGHIKFQLNSLGSTIHSVGRGSSSGVDADRKEYVDRRGRLERALTEAGIGTEVRAQVRATVDERTRDAAGLGRAAAERREEWTAKIDGYAAARDDAIAQRQAADAGRTPGPARVCAPSPDRDRTAAASRTAAAGRRQLHTEEVER
ncbi:hypothetical protein [Nocardia sp. NPDC051570]|uniref:hypothetical protein n=1 Tax=Nocardia sp. NPDC051570 TaxID=3364324 RepID=UPI0037AE19FC